MKRPVVPDQRWRVGPQHFAEGFLAGFGRNIGIEPVDGIPQPPDENHVAKGIPFRPRLAGRYLRAVQVFISEFLKPLDRRKLNF